MTDELSRRQKVAVFGEILRFNLPLSAAIVAGSLVIAVLEGIGVSFLLPIVQIATTDAAAGSATDDPLFTAFETAYATLGIPFTLSYLVAGVATVMGIRLSGNVLLAWMKAKLQSEYTAALKSEAFERTLEAELQFVEERGSEAVLNTIVTEINYAASAIITTISLIKKSFLALAYAILSFYIAPILTILAIAVLGSMAAIVRYVIEPAYTRGNAVAEANERLQEVAQSGVQGLREVKLFGTRDQMQSSFDRTLEQYVTNTVRLRRNSALLSSTYKFTNMIVVFGLLYVALAISGLSLGMMAVFLFAMYRLLPIVSSINDYVYNLEGKLPHVIRAQEFLDRLEAHEESSTTARPVDRRIDELTYRNVEFAYDDDIVVDGVSATVQRGEFAAFVGPSGAGKSTLLALTARLYDPDSGEIRADGTPIGEFAIDEWRSRVAMVTQDPYLFNETLHDNVALGAPDADRADVRRVCELARVTEFVDDLPNGYDTELGENGVRLSGGQRQRVAVARTLLKDADVLLLDEATSDLDAELETEIFENVKTNSSEQIVLVVTHRLGTVTAADTIYTVENGRIVESGAHGELMQNGQTYAQLYDRQPSA